MITVAEALAKFPGSNAVYCAIMKDFHLAYLDKFIAENEWTEEALEREVAKWALKAIDYFKRGRFAAGCASTEMFKLFLWIFERDSFYIMASRHLADMQYSYYRYPIDAEAFLSRNPKYLEGRCLSGSCPDRFFCKLHIPWRPGGEEPAPIVCPVMQSASFGHTMAASSQSYSLSTNFDLSEFAKHSIDPDRAYYPYQNVPENNRSDYSVYRIFDPETYRQEIDGYRRKMHP